MTPRQQKEARAIVKAVLADCTKRHPSCASPEYAVRVLHDRARPWYRGRPRPNPRGGGRHD